MTASFMAPGKGLRSPLVVVKAANLVAEYAFVTLLLLAGSYVFLFPASEQLFTRKFTGYIGDGGQDAQWLPFAYNTILETWKHRPRLMLYGSVFSPQVNAPFGGPIFMPWCERLLIGVVMLFQRRVEPLVTLVMTGLVVVNGLSMYLFARTMKWSRFIAFALAFAWAFNPYSRARIDVHTSLAAPFIFPLILVAMRWVHNSMSPPSLREAFGASARTLRIGAAVIMVFAFFAAHYYWFVTLLLSPVFLVYFIMSRPERTPRTHGLGWLVACAVPAVVFLAWNLAVPAPKALLVGAPPLIGDYSDKNINYALAAKPADYLAGDVRFSLEDYMPFRKQVNEWVMLPDRLNTCETVNGIRWIILAITLAGLITLAVPYFRRRLSSFERRSLGGMVVLGLFGFLLSLRPDFIAIGGEHVNLSRFACAILPYFRCPCRAGPLAHFGALLVSGFMVSRWQAQLSSRITRVHGAGILVTGAFVLLTIFDTVPKGQLILTGMRRTRKELESRPGDCGTGVYGPVGNAWEHLARTQEFYGTSCRLVPTPARIPVTGPNMAEYARCAGLSWFAYQNPTVVTEACKSLGWQQLSPDSCRASASVTANRDMEACLK